MRRLELVSFSSHPEFARQSVGTRVEYFDTVLDIQSLVFSRSWPSSGFKVPIKGWKRTTSTSRKLVQRPRVPMCVENESRHTHGVHASAGPRDRARNPINAIWPGIKSLLIHLIASCRACTSRCVRTRVGGLAVKTRTWRSHGRQGFPCRSYHEICYVSRELLGNQRRKVAEHPDDWTLIQEITGKMQSIGMNSKESIE